LKNKTWYQLEKNDTKFNLLDEQGNSNPNWQNLDLQNIANNHFDLYKNGQLVISNIQKSVTTMSFLEE